MEKTLNFHDRKGTCLLRLTPAKAEYSGTDLLRTAVEFNVGAFAGRIGIDAMSYDFANLRKGLTAIYEGRISHYGFVTMEDELSMDFEMDELGGIAVKVSIAKYRYNIDAHFARLEFEYTMDQSFIPEQIREIDEITA